MLGFINLLPVNEAAATGLVSFSGCRDALDHLKNQAEERVGPWGYTAYPGGGREVVEDAPTAAESDGANAAVQPRVPHSTTNVQEAGVDEPDVVKTDGRMVVTTQGGTLRVVDVTGAQPREVGQLSITDEDGAEANLLLSDDRALVFVRDYSTAEHDMAYPGWEQVSTRMLLVDLSDPANPTVESTLHVDGSYVDARLVDGTVRVVVSSPPKLASPQVDGPQNEDELVERSRAVIEKSTIEDWLPSYTLTTGEHETSGQLVSCDRLNRPTGFAGFSVISVLTLGLDELTDGDAVGVVTDGDTVYASSDRLYVATATWAEPADDANPTDGDEPTDIGSAGGGEVGSAGGADVAVPIAPRPTVLNTAIHAFDTSSDDPARYLASEEVDGSIIGRYAMSEHEGILRVATTTQSEDIDNSESHVVTLAERGNELEQVGHVGGLGKGERIYAVRYFGDTGYVVTFRQVDPLYVLDLSDPAAPSVEGELKITGYSSYLHGIGGDRLLGVGQEATEGGQAVGSQVSLFDVADPADPRKLDGHVSENMWSDVEQNPHAFLYWPQTRQVVVPVYGARMDQQRKLTQETAGVLVLNVDDDSLTEHGLITRGGVLPRDVEYYYSTVMRSMVIGDSLYTLWQDGLQVNDLDDLEFQSWLPLETAW